MVPADDTIDSHRVSLPEELPRAGCTQSKCGSLRSRVFFLLAIRMLLL